MTDIVERLRQGAGHEPADIMAAEKTMDEAAKEIERLREEVATWRSRYEAERRDHEATMKAWDEERSGL